MNARDLRAKGKEMKKVMMTAALVAFVSAASASWTTYSLPTATDSYSWALGHTDDGRFIYANNGTFYRQDTFGSGSVTTYANSPGSSVGPSFIAAGGSTAVAGTGGWTASPLLTFAADDTAGTSFSTNGVSLQNYVGRMRDSNSFYVGGANGTGGNHSLSYVTLDGSQNKVVIDNISTYSCGFAVDGSGNLYVGDNDDGKVYYFAKSQLDNAIAGSALAITDGAEVANFGSGGQIGSLAVDGNGVLWAAGWMDNGITSYDPNLDQYYDWTPGHASTSYLVDTFSKDGTDYVAFVSNSGIGDGSDVIYGIADAQIVPEPSTVILMAGGFGGLVWFRRRRKYFFRG